MRSTMILHALRPFIGTERGQVSVDIDTELVLLSDTHWYWWFVRDGKTGGEGFVPADILELPNERLARLNRQMNIHLPSSPLDSRGRGCKRVKSVHFVGLDEPRSSFDSLESLELDSSSQLDSSDSEESLVSSLDSERSLSDLHLDEDVKNGGAHVLHIRAPEEVNVFTRRSMDLYE